MIDWLDLVLWCLTSISTIFQLYRGGQFCWRKTRVPEENHRRHKSLINFIT